MRTPMLLAAVLTLAGCASSPPTRFYTLDPVDSAGAPQARLARPLEVDAVHIPALVNRRWMIRGENGPAVTISGRDRWTGNLGELCRQVLSRDLASRLPSGMVVPPHTPAPPGTRGVVVSITAFEPQSGGEVALDADWTLVAGVGAKPVLHRTVRLRAPEGPSAGTEARAMSQLLGRLADRIVAGISKADGAGAS
jgi:uncharacterized lipoprotein YmbA